MLKNRIIPCLDIQNGRTVKGVNFESIRDAGDPIELAQRYVIEGADELVFLDITATLEKRKTLIDLVKQVAHEIHIPFTVGGGINSLEVAKLVIDAGADKISVNSSALKNPDLVQQIANEYGSQCVVVAIDTKYMYGDWYVFSSGGKIPTGKKAVDWAEVVVAQGAGEILLTSMNSDGTKSGFSLDITKQIADSVNIPVIASGGAGTMQHFADVFTETKATGALAASVFHYQEIEIPELKYFLKNLNIPIR